MTTTEPGTSTIDEPISPVAFISTWDDGTRGSTTLTKRSQRGQVSTTIHHKDDQAVRTDVNIHYVAEFRIHPPRHYSNEHGGFYAVELGITHDDGSHTVVTLYTHPQQ